MKTRDPIKLNTVTGIIAAVVLTISESAHAYVGPGLGLGTIGAVLGTLAAILLAFFAVLYYPIKRIFKRRNKKSRADAESTNSTRDKQQPIK